MRLLLLKDVRKLGYVGDVVDVKPGYARNYLVPEGLATEPNETNIRAIAVEKERAAMERARRFKEYESLVAKMVDVSITIERAANPEGTLYGSVSRADIAKALQAQGYPIDAEHVVLAAPIRQLDNVKVKVEFTDELTTDVKVWVVREGETAGADAQSKSESGAEPAAAAVAES